MSSNSGFFQKLSLWKAGWLTLIFYSIAEAIAYWGLAPIGTPPCHVWLPGGVGLAATICWGAWMAIPLFFASLGFQYWSVGEVLSAVPVANALGPMVGGWLVRKKCLSPLLPVYRVMDVVWFLALGIGVSAAISALGGALYLTGKEVSTPWNVYSRWWLADLSGSITLAPLLLFILSGEQPIRFQLKRPEQLEILIVSLITLGLAWVIFFVLYSPAGHYIVMPYLLMLPLLWATSRLPLFLAHYLSFLVIILALLASATGHGAFYVNAAGVPLTNTAWMIFVQAVTLLVIGALVSERRQAEENIKNINLLLEAKVDERTVQLAESEARFRLLVDAAPFPLIMSRLSDGQLLYINQRAKDQLFSQLDTKKIRYFVDLFSNVQKFNSIKNTLIKQGVLKDYEVRLRNNKGYPFWASLSCSLINTEEVHYVITSINDISERKALEQSLKASNYALRQHLLEIESLQQGLRDQALRDPLTGLFNRRYLDETLPRLLAQCLMLKQPLSIAMVDVDHFKRVNDTYGHHGGDEVLSMVGSYLSERFRSSDIVCRYGGEEFVIVLPDTTLETAKQKAELLCQDIRQRVFHAGANIVKITLSIGVAYAGYHNNDHKLLLYAADAALYAAKNQGRDRVVAVLSEAERLVGHDSSRGSTDA